MIVQDSGDGVARVTRVYTIKLWRGVLRSTGVVGGSCWIQPKSVEGVPAQFMWLVWCLYFESLAPGGNTFLLAIYMNDQEMGNYEFLERLTSGPLFGNTNTHKNLTQKLAVMSTTTTLVWIFHGFKHSWNWISQMKVF